VLVRVLGAIELVAADGGTVALSGTRQPALLAALAARAGEVVSADRLISLLWGEALPENPEASLHSAVFKLRSRLQAVGGHEVLLTRDHGYQLRLRRGELDAEVFESLVATAAQQEPGAAASTLADALALWRGAAYGPLSDTEVGRAEAMRLEEARRTAVERRADALLACGRAEEVVWELESFVAEHPLREAARVTLMRALHTLGRTPEALEHYQAYRRVLADELGLEPSGTMRAVQVEVLREPTEPARRSAVARPPHGPPRGLPGLQVQYLRTPSGSVLACGRTGSGPRLVVLLGWISSLEVIGSGRDPRSSLLERLSGHVALTLFDRAGTGLSPGPVVDGGLETSVEEVLTVVEHVGPPVSLLAMSAAGPIAVATAARRPGWVSSLVFFGTFANAATTFTDVRLRTTIVEIARNHWGMGSKLLADLYRPGAGDEAAWHLARVLRESAPAEVAADYLQAIYDQDVSPLLPTIEAPALVLHYRGDRLVGFRGAQDLAAGLPRATLVALDGRVHLPDASDLDRLEELIVRHVSRG
jgi:DNA-binding SARP family transcriptional activator/pimeloyl-ACP methyl ester carboxylesterase